jgi:hypothetical protein
VLAPPSTRAHDRISTTITWTGEIGPLVSRRCVSCHTRRGFAFPLTTYDEARPWAVAIKQEVLAGHMPPWGAAPGIGQFANDRRLTRHEMELIAAWVDGGAPRSANARAAGVRGSQSAAASAESPSAALEGAPPAAVASAAGSSPGTLVPLANAVIESATERTASVTLQLPPGFSLVAWSFEPGTPAIVERAALELGTRWLGAWTPGDGAIEFPPDAGVPLGNSALFTARITYRAPGERVVDFSGLRVWMTRDERPKTVRETTVLRSWRTTAAVDVFAVRPTGTADVEVVARFPDGRVEPVGAFSAPAGAPHPTYRLARPVALPVGARVEVTGAVRLLYTGGATRTVNPKVTRRPPR